MLTVKILVVILAAGAGVFWGAVLAMASEDIEGKMMIRKCDIGKVLFYARYDAKELPGFRFSVGKLTIKDVSINGMFKAEEMEAWLPQDFVSADRLFWRSWECEEYCRRRNAQEFRRMMSCGQYSRAS